MFWLDLAPLKNKMIINFKKIAKTPLRKKALLIASAGYEAIDIQKSIKQKIKIKNEVLEVLSTTTRRSKQNTVKISLKGHKRVFIIGTGKGSALASLTLAKVLGKYLTGGIFLDTIKLNPKPYALKAFRGTHPLSSSQNIRATQKIIKLAKSLKKDDLLVTFICGGGSALFCSSEKELNASKTVFKKLTEAGANILELNTVRKHISEIKGGGLAKIAYPATVISLVASDVLGDDLSMVASGPTVFDKTTKKDAEKILRNYNLRSTTNNLQLLETPKDKKYFKEVKNILFVSNRDAISAMAKKSQKLGLKPKIYSYSIGGEAKESLNPLIKRIRNKESVLAAGETTVLLKGLEVRNGKLGKGGRNTESVLGALVNSSPISHLSSLLIISFASDGHDNTEAAGAIGDSLTIEKAKKLKLDPEKFLEEHDSFNFFKKTGDLIFVDKTSFNVSDLMVVLKK